jgi:hypothetical protein
MLKPSFEKIYNKLEDVSLIEKRILIRDFYYKYIIKTNKSKFKNDLSITIDNFFSYEKTNYLPKAYFKKNNFAGHSINIKKENFTARYMPNIQMKLPFLSQKSFIAGSMKRIQRIIKEETKEIFSIFMLFSSTRGGFKVYSLSGAIGILPFKQVEAYYALERFEKSLVTYKLLFAYLKDNSIRRPFCWIIGYLSKVNLVKFNPIESKAKKRLTRASINNLMNPYIQFKNKYYKSVKPIKYLFLYKAI